MNPSVSQLQRALLVMLVKLKCLILFGIFVSLRKSILVTHWVSSHRSKVYNSCLKGGPQCGCGLSTPSWELRQQGYDDDYGCYYQLMTMMINETSITKHRLNWQWVPFVYDDDDDSALHWLIIVMSMIMMTMIYNRCEAPTQLTPSSTWWYWWLYFSTLTMTVTKSSN